VQVNDAKDIRFHLEKACTLATTGRPGPVWIDVPLNVQSANIQPETLAGYTETQVPIEPTTSEIDDVIQRLNSASRPLIIVGNGVRLSGGVSQLREFLSKSKIPVITAINGNDIVNNDYDYYYGRFGTHAQICANNLLKECDLLLTIGSRLYVRQTGYNFENFAHQAYRIYVDVDENELNKPTLYPNKKIVSDAKAFINKLLEHNIETPSQAWYDICNEYNAAPKVLDRHRDKTDFVSNYSFIEKLSNKIPKDYHVVTSDGSANVVTMQVLNLTGDQRLITNTGCAPMGYGLPAAIGASFNHNIVCIEGDGSLHLNVHELQTLKHYNRPIKLIVLNNDGYLSIKVTQKAFFKGHYVASEKSSGVTLPNYEKIFSAYDIPYFKIKTNNEVDSILEAFFSHDGPVVCEVFTDPEEYHEPKVIAKLDKDGNFIPGELSNIQWINK
jgi:acetolactate synthase-1/2/3 large subunit